MISSLKKIILWSVILLFFFFAGRLSSEFEGLNKVLDDFFSRDAAVKVLPKIDKIPAQQISLHTLDISRDSVYAGLPKGGDCALVINKGFKLGYSKKFKNPLWVAYKLDSGSKFKKFEAPEEFSPDGRTFVPLKHEDFEDDFYERGQMAPHLPLGRRFGHDSYKQTFLTSNICPRKSKLNRKLWPILEEKVAWEYAESFDQVWVVTGPVFDKGLRTLKSGVVVPDRFFKIVLRQENNSVKALAFLIDQEVSGEEALSLFLVSVDKIEKLTGLDFFPDLPAQLQQPMEAEVAVEIW